jgi:hypothetical protein
MPFKNWPEICKIKSPLMRLWISYEEDQATLSLAQLGFPHLFTDKQEEGKTGPFPLSHLRRLMNQHTLKEGHTRICEWEEENQCAVCKYYSRLPDFPVPFISLKVEELPTEVWSQIEVHLGSKPQCEMYFPHKLYEIEYQGEIFYLGCIDLLEISLVVKTAVYIDM